MADKKLNQVSQLTDFDYALVVKGNDVAKVTKQQLATILGELLPDSLGFFKPYTPVSGQDLDQMLNMGFYKIQPLDLSSSNPNLPEGAYSYGSLIVFDNPLDNEKRKVQIYIPNGHAYFYTRVANNGAFYKWNKFNGNEL
ncbi:pyocin knob domain-containing protein [Phocaeicola vulgatus]|nr:pyocin knob domain-containing protein [Phocaeicola vulgatus]